MSQQATIKRTLEFLMLLNQSLGKTIDELSNRFDMSRRTVYRYLNTMKDAGFVIENTFGRYRIDQESSIHDISKLLHFSEEEGLILSKAIHEIDSDDRYRRRLAQKLYSLYDFDRVVYAINKKEDSENILQILKGIKKRKQIVLKEYRSGNSNTVRDRIVEPIDFTYHYNALWALDIEDKKTKLFRTSRFSKVMLREERFKYSDLHNKGIVDVFRTAGFGTTKVQLKLSLRAYSLLIEEYPLAEKDITELSTGEYLFDSKVCSFEGVGRFAMGLPGEVKIIGPKELKEFVRDRVKLLDF